MPGPIGVGKKILRTAARRRVASNVVKNAGARSEAGGGGRSLFDNAQDLRSVERMHATRAAQSAQESIEISTYEESFYDMALDMCENDGQKAIIEEMGPEAFSAAATAHNEGGDAVDELIALCPHPEVVEDILSEVGSAIADEIESQWGDGEGYGA